MQVAALDLTRQSENLAVSLDEVFQRVLNSGNYILGEEVNAFEEKMANYLGVDYALGVANGSDALVLALKALEIGPGDEVIVPAFAFLATASSVSLVGATPVFADVSENDYNLDLNSVRQKITEKTKALIPVHLFGMPVEMEPLMELAAQHQLAVIEDTAHALGSTYGVEPVGTFGDIGTFSFFPTNNLSCLGDGGMVVTNREDLAKKLQMLRFHGAKAKNHYELLGYNSCLDSLQAAFLNVKLPHLNAWNNARRLIATNYRTAFEDIKEIVLPEDSEGHSYNQFTILTSKRDGLRKYLAKNGISTTIHYPKGLHLQPLFRHLNYQEGDLPVTEKLSQRVLSLPIFPELTKEEQNFVIGKVMEFYQERRGER